MKELLTIIKKEFARFFRDTRLMLTVLILPGLLIYALYSVVGTIMESVEKKEQEYEITCVVQNKPESLSTALDAVFTYSEDTLDCQERVKSGVLSLYIIFPEDFDSAVADYSPSSGVAAPQVRIYYNSGNKSSLAAYNIATSLLTFYEESISNKFDVNSDADTIFDLADAQSTSRMILSMVVPMVLLMLLFSGCMSVAPESIAGEKERGTIATLLVTPVKRSSVAVGKIIALSVIALLSGLSSTIGLILSLPKIASGEGVDISLSMYGFGDYMAILGVVLSTVLILVTLISIISAFAKSVKEASGLVIPVMLITLLCGVFSMFASGLSSIGLFFIPLFNSALVISSVLSGAVSGAAVAITVCVNIAFTALLVFLLTLMFKSERIMFNK